MPTTVQEPTTNASDRRDSMVTALLKEGHITSAAVEAAFRAVAREQFAPDGTDLATLYHPDKVVVTKRGHNGRAISSISAASIQAFMIEQAQLRPGIRVLEIGSGGVNAAYLAEIVGPDGYVITVDIDADVTDRAARSLDAAGYGNRVRVLQADAHHGIPGEAAFDAILVTVQCWDISPTWLEQLTPTGVLVLPLTLRGGVSRSIAFRREDGRWISHDARMCGFVDMQGVGRHAEHHLTITDPDGAEVIVTFDADEPHNIDLPADLMAGPPVELWSGVSFPHRTSWADMYVYFACYLTGFCRLSTPGGDGYPAAKSAGLPYAVARAGALAYLTFRPLDNPDEGVEFGARGFGADGQLAAQAIIEQVQQWDASARHLEPWFSYEPKQLGGVERATGTAILPKVDGSILIHWPVAGSRAN